MKGTLRERSPGVWQLRVYVGDDAHGNPLQASKTWRNEVGGKLVPGGRRRAESALSGFVTEIESGRRPTAETVGELLDRWLDHIRPKRAASTMSRYEQKVRARLKPAFGSTKLSKLSALQLDTQYSQWLAGGLSSTTVDNLHDILSAALHQGVRWGLIPRAVTEDADPPAPRTNTATAPGVEVVSAMLERAEKVDPRKAIAIVLAATTGARRGEICRLRRADVDLAGARLTYRGTKNESSHRTIALDPMSVACLELHFRRQSEWAAAALVDLDPNPYVVARDPDASAPFHPDTLTHFMSTVANGEHHFHELRHFTATQMIGAGLDPRTVAGRLGHADANTTLRVYAHFIEERDREAANLMGRLLGGPADLRLGAGAPVEALGGD